MSFEMEERHAGAGYAGVRPRTVGRSDDLLQEAEAAPFARCSDLSCYRWGCCSTQKTHEERAEGLGEFDRGEHERQGLLVVSRFDYDQQRHRGTKQFRHT